MPNNTKIHKLSWNHDLGCIACGGEGGILKVIKLDTSKGQGGGNLSMNQTLQGHNGSIKVVRWNELHRKLTTADENGLIIVWMLHKNHWFEEMINNRNKSIVTDQKWTSNGEKICIIYQDGAVIVGSVEGNRLWGKDFDHELSFAEWAPDGRTILFATPSGEVKVYDYLGNFLFDVVIYCNQSGEEEELAGLRWFDGGLNGYITENYPEENPTLCICYQNGKMQLMKHENDDMPITIDSGMRINSVNWSPNGTILSIGGQFKEGEDVKSAVQFYTPHGNHLRTLRVPGLLNDISWEGTGLRMVLAVDAALIFANVQPNYQWTYFNNTLVFTYRKPDRVDQCIVFWDIRNDQKYTKYVKNLEHLMSAGEYSVLVTKSDEKDLWLLVLTNSIGSHVETRIINIEPMSMAMSATHVLVANESSVYLWHYRKQSVASMIDLDKRKTGRELAFYVDELPNDSAVYDREKFNAGKVTSDPISAVAIELETFIIGRNSGLVLKYILPHVSIDKKLQLRCRPQMMAMNSNSTIISIIDINGVLSFYDLESSNSKLGTGEHLPGERKDVWSMVWSADSPNLFAMMEKNRMYIMRDLQPEEPVLSSGYLCQFTDLEITGVSLDEIMRNPDSVKKIDEYVINFETKALRDAKSIMGQVGLDEALAYVEQNKHPRLWKLLAQCGLEQLNFQIAEKAFIELEDYHGVNFVKRLSVIDDSMIKKAEIASFYGRFDEAEQIFKEIDRRDLALELRQKLGDHAKVIELLEQGAGNDLQLKEAYNKMGEYYGERKKWKKAGQLFQNAQNYKMLIESYYRAEDYENLQKLVHVVPEDTILLEALAIKFQSVGLCESAVEAYLKMGDVKKAIDCCVVLNHWNAAVDLAEKYNFVQIEGLLNRYATHLLEKNKRMEAIELYRKANKNTESAKLLAKLAEDLRKQNVNLLLVKKIYVLAAFEVDSYKKRIFEAQMTGQSVSAAQTLDSLITTDINTSDVKALNNPWKGAEAIHYYLLCQRQLYQRNYSAGLKTAMRLAEYEKELDTKEVYSLIALAAANNGSFKEASRAFVKLEHLDSISQGERDKYEQMAVSLFSKFPPDEGKKVMLGCPGKNCGGMVSEFDTHCMKCGAYFSACVASGQSILAKKYYTCKTCKHKALLRELQLLNAKHCPLCHAKIVPQ